MSDEIDCDFTSADDAKAELRAAVGYLLKDAAGSNRDDIVRVAVMAGFSRFTSLNALAVEAFNDLLKKHGKRTTV